MELLLHRLSYPTQTSGLHLFMTDEIKILGPLHSDFQHILSPEALNFIVQPYSIAVARSTQETSAGFELRCASEISTGNFTRCRQRWLMNQGKQEPNQSSTELSPHEWEVIACTGRPYV